MKRKYKILLIVAGVLTVFYATAKFYFEGPYFAQLVANEINTYIKASGHQLAFNKIKVQFLKGQINFLDVHFKWHGHEEQDWPAQEVALSFTYWDLLWHDVVIEEIKIRQSKIALTDSFATELRQALTTGRSKPTGATAWWKAEAVEKIYAAYTDFFLENLGRWVRRVTLEDLDLQYQSGRVQLKQIEAALRPQGWMITGDLQVNHLQEFLANGQSFPQDLSLGFSLQGTKTNLRVGYLALKTPTTDFKLTGLASAQRGVLRTSGRVDFNGEVALWPRAWWPQQAWWRDQQAQGNLNVAWQGQGKDYDVNFAVDLKDVKLAEGTFERVQASGKFKDQKLTLTTAELTLGAGKMALRRPADLYSWKQNAVTPFHLGWNLQRLEMAKAFSFMGDKLTFIEGKVSGNLEIKADLAQEKMFFTLLDKYTVEDFAIRNRINQQKILGQAKLVGQESTVDLYHQRDVFLDLNFAAPDFTINLNGTVLNRDAKLKISSPHLNFKSFGPIVGVPMTGEGPVAVTVIDEKITTVEVQADQVKDYSVLGFNLGPMSGKVLINIDDDYLDLQDINGQTGNAAYLANGRISWKKDLDLDLAIQTRNMSFQESLKVYAPLLKNIRSYLPQHLEFFYQADYQVKGDPEKNLQVYGQVQGQNLRYYQEMASSLGLDFAFENNVLRFNNISLVKNQGQIRGSYLADLKTDYHELELSFQKLLLSDFNYYQMLNLGLQGSLSGDWFLSGTQKDYSGRGKLSLTDAQVGTRQLPTSNLTVYLNNGEISFETNLWHDRLTMNGRLWEGPRQISRINFKTDFEDLRLPFGILDQRNLQRPNLAGLLKGSGNMVFHGKNFLLQEIALQLAAFDFRYDDLAVHRHPRWHHLQLKANTKTENDQILLQGTGINASFKNVQGTRDARLAVRYAVDAKLLELLGPLLSSAKGQIEGSLELGLQQDLDHEIKMQGKDLSLKFVHWPLTLEKLNFTASLRKDQISIPQLSLMTGRGRVRGKGRLIFFPELLPQVQLSIDKVAIPFLKKSFVTVSGNVQIEQGHPPYVIKGKIIAENGEIIDDLSSFQGGRSNEDYQQYLPTHQDDKFIQQFVYQLAFENRRPLIFKNNFFDMQLNANGKVGGGLLRPVLDGEIVVLPEVSKFVFKGHEFKATEGKVAFHGDARHTPKEIHFIGNSKIEDYDIHLEVGGTTDKIDAQLSSRPALGQEDLLNLITFGVTPEINKSLTEASRNSVVSLGVGGLLMDQLQLGQGLKSALGVSVSVAPEFSDNESSLLPGEGSNNRFNAATKIKMQKQIHKNMDLSVSSVIGGSSTQQRQSMNLNYNLNNNISVQGVYEIKNNQDINQNENTNSSGVDLKWRWSFK